MSAPSSSQPTDTALGLPERLLWIFGVGVAVASAGPAVGLWRFQQGVINPWWLALVAAVVVAAAPLLERSHDRLSAWAAALSLPQRRTRAVLVVALLAATTWLLFRYRIVRPYGDAGAIIGFLDRGVVFHKREPLSAAIYLAFRHTVGAWLGLDARGSIQLATSMGGALGLWAIARFAGLLANGRRLLSLTLFAAIATAGAVQLFFGYIENYTLPTVCALWFLYFGCRAFIEDRSVLPAAALLTLGTLIHLSLIALAPALGWLAWRRHFAGRPRPLFRALTLALVTVVPVVLVIVVMHLVGYLRAEESGFGGGDGRMFVPLLDTSGKYHQYLFLRPGHLAAILNLQLLVAPMALVTCGVLGLSALRSRLKGAAGPFGGALLIFVALAAAGYFGLTVVWNPDLGALRDWDLFGPVGFYLMCLVGMLVLDRLDDRRAFALLVFIVAVNLTRTLPFIWRNLAM